MVACVQLLESHSAGNPIFEKCNIGRCSRELFTWCSGWKCKQNGGIIGSTPGLTEFILIFLILFTQNELSYTLGKVSRGNFF